MKKCATFRFYAFPLLACAWLLACAPPRKPVPAPPPAPAKISAPRLTAEQEKKVEQLYYKAVGAYSNNEMSAAGAFLKEIFAIHPSYQPAQELKRKIGLAAGRE